MPFLDAALAFALTMFVAATCIAQIVRILQHVARLRNKELQKMLVEYFNNDLQPVVTREFNRLKKGAASAVSANLSKTSNDDNLGLFEKEELTSLIEVSTAELTERLKRSEFGAKLFSALGDEAQTIFDELGRRYEVVGDKFTESFRKHSRWWATGVALVLALVVNIDSIHIANSYIRNASLREGVIAQMDAIVTKYDVQVASLKDSVSDSTVAPLKQAVGDSKEQINLLKSAGFPIGWSNFPHSIIKGKTSKSDEKIGTKGDEKSDTKGDWMMWLLGIILTAFFAGFLGAPFWYDTITGISRLTAQAGRKSTARPANT